MILPKDKRCSLPKGRNQQCHIHSSKQHPEKDCCKLPEIVFQRSDFINFRRLFRFYSIHRSTFPGEYNTPLFQKTFFLILSNLNQRLKQVQTIYCQLLKTATKIALTEFYCKAKDFFFGFFYYIFIICLYH